MCLTQPVKGANGTAKICQVPGFETAAKTGTTDNFYDKWLCGFTEHYTAVTWYGYDVGNVTAMETTPIPYYTIAVDPNVIPLGSYCTVVFPDGRVFECRAEDTGGMVYGYHIDMYVDEPDVSLDYWDNISGVTVYIH